VTSYSINEFWYEGEWITVVDGPLIEVSIVLHGSEFSSFLLDEEERGGIGRFGLSNEFVT
jgi:hypothetical protein